MITPRYNMYRLIHKGVRVLTSETLVAVGRMDSDDPAEVTETCRRVRSMLDFCHHHMDNEDRYVHPVMEARAVGSTATVSGDHAHHLESIESLRKACDRLEAAAPAERAEAAHALYLELAVFVGENLVHMNMEESEHNTILWRCYSDIELIAVERGIVGSMPREAMAETLRWMVPSASPGERAAFLCGLRNALPPPVFEDILDIVTPHLGAVDRAKLDTALGRHATAA